MPAEGWLRRQWRSSGDADGNLARLVQGTRVGVCLGTRWRPFSPARSPRGWPRAGCCLTSVTEDEWAGGRIAGSVHIPMDQLMQRLDEVDDRVVCVCAVGARSARVAQFLNAQGREAVNLDGGIYAWANSGLPVER